MKVTTVLRWVTEHQQRSYNFKINKKIISASFETVPLNIFYFSHLWPDHHSAGLRAEVLHGVDAERSCAGCLPRRYPAKKSNDVIGRLATRLGGACAPLRPARGVGAGPGRTSSRRAGGPVHVREEGRHLCFAHSHHPSACCGSHSHLKGRNTKLFIRMNM